MVDAGDLKSPELCSCGFESHRPHHPVLSIWGYHQEWIRGVHLWRSSARFSRRSPQIYNERPVGLTQLSPTFGGRSLTQKLLIQVGLDQPEHDPLLSPVEWQSDAQQGRVGKANRLATFEDCHDDVGCQAREV